ncbi:MAG: hypothetical protein V4581_03990 [Bacteroidota bacterium]
MNDFELDEYKLKPGFSTPDGYFESLADKVMLQLPKAEVRVIPLYRRKPVWLSAAAAFIIMLGFGIFFRSMLFTPQTVQPDAEAIENYLVYQQGINSYQLTQNLDQKDIAELNETIDVSHISADDIEEYLSTEDIYITE